MALQKERSTVTIDAAAQAEAPPREVKAVAARDADETLGLEEEFNGEAAPPTPKESRRLNRKLYANLILLVCVINLMLFIDKATLGQAVFLGILDDLHISDANYNNLNTLFYTGYIIGQLPAQRLIQRLPMSKYVSATIFIWAVLIFAHCGATSYGSLIPLRLLLGFVESGMVPALEMTMGMFFVPHELHAMQPLFWISCVGAPIPSGLLGYALLWSKASVAPWKLFMITTGGLTLLLAVFSWFWYPDNPAKARFLSPKERLQVISRVRNATRGSIEQKKFKKYQFYEALRDPISWLFALAAFALMLANNLSFQQSLILLSLGVGNLGSTLVTVAGGGFAVACAIVASLLMRLFPGYSAWWSTLWVLPAIAGSIGMVALPWGRTIPLLACLLIAGNTFANTYITSLVWTSSSATGYTKKLTRNTMFMISYGVSNIISPQMWKSGGPRYYGTWIAQIVVSFCVTPLALHVVRIILKKRNKEREVWIADQAALGNFGDGVVDSLDAEGNVVQKKVDISVLDLTDLENKFFIYPL
ncbi:major facilitator superfamily domain-containing protein [Aspergillus pseudoustus]|uniref:Major facilitator superfamily domain-containing protein n=1 Tax=Aspergillus pseudoustus TaxID=1810923 RepID=A0ABR4KD48_9EURO